MLKIQESLDAFGLPLNEQSHGMHGADLKLIGMLKDLKRIRDSEPEVSEEIQHAIQAINNIRSSLLQAHKKER